MNDPIQYPETLDELRGIVVAALVDRGDDVGKALSAAVDIVERVRGAWGGQKIYIPTGKSIETEKMRREVLARWNGKNTRELCDELGVTESRLRQLHQEARVGTAPQLF